MRSSNADPTSEYVSLQLRGRQGQPKSMVCTITSSRSASSTQRRPQEGSSNGRRFMETFMELLAMVLRNYWTEDTM